MVEPTFLLAPGEPIAALAEQIYIFTETHRSGRIIVDLATFENVSAGKVFSLLKELPLVDRFVEKNFCGTLEVRNAFWPLTTALYAVYNGLILSYAANAQMVLV